MSGAMRRMRTGLAMLAAGALALAACVPAGAQRAGDMVVENPWVRATPPGGMVSGGFVTLRNVGERDDRLLSVESAAAQRVELHEMRNDGGMMRMRPVTGGLPIRAGAKVELAPGGYHLMFIAPKQPFVDGDLVVATLRFERAGAIEVSFRVRGAGAMRDEGAMHHH